MYNVTEKPFYIITLNTLPPNLFNTEMKSVPTMGAINMRSAEDNYVVFIGLVSSNCCLVNFNTNRKNGEKGVVNGKKYIKGYSQKKG